MGLPVDYNKYKLRPVFLWEDNEQAFVRTEENGNMFAKFPGESEYKLNEHSNMAWRAILADHEVSKQQYDLGSAILP